MNFLSPAFLLALPLAAVPVVIHLLSRRQQKKISWGAMRFLMQAATRRRRLWRLTDLLLLILRTAAFLFLIFALSRPLLPTNWLGGSVPRDVILVVDQSLSMTRSADGTTLFDLQLQKAREALDALGSSDSVRVVLAGETPEWLMVDPLPATASNVRRVRGQLDAIKPSLGGGNLIAALREATDLEAPKDKSARLIVVITDGQRIGWRLEETPLWSAVRTRLENAPIPTTVNLQAVGSKGAEANLAVSSVESPRPYGSMLQPLSFVATVVNHGTELSEPTLLAWRVNELPAGVTTIPSLAPGANTTVTLDHSFQQAGEFEVVCELEAKDVLSADNVGRCLVDIYERLPVLLVEDSAQDEDSIPDSSFLLAALGAHPGQTNQGWRSVFEPTLISSAALATTDLNAYRCILLVDTPVLPQATLDRVEAYVRNGGGAWWALGARTDERVFNEQVHRGGLGLAPMKVTTPIGDPDDREKFVAIRATSEAHPATALLSDFQRLDLDRARVFRRHQFAAVTAKGVSVLLQAQGGEPVVVERRFGTGRVLVQAIPLGVTWSTLPLCQAYVPLIHEWFWYLSEPTLPRHNLQPGDALVADAYRNGLTAELILPDARSMELTSSGSPMGSQFRHGGTRQPGPYLLKTRLENGDKSEVRFLVHRDPTESDLKPLADSDLQSLAAIQGFRIGGRFGELVTDGESVPPKRPLEGWFLVILPFLLLGELALAAWTNHRRDLRVPAAAMTA